MSEASLHPQPAVRAVSANLRAALRHLFAVHSVDRAVDRAATVPPMFTAISRVIITAIVTVIVTVTVSQATPAQAAPAPAINAQSYEFAPSQYDGLLVRSARPPRDNSWQLGAGLHYARRALTFANRSGAAPLVQTVFGDLWMLDLGAARALGQWTLEATLPIALVTRGGGPNLIGTDDPLAPAFGDLRIGARRHLWQADVDGVGHIDLGALLLWAAPTGAKGGWLSNGGARVDALGLATWRRFGWQADLAAGLRLRPLERLRVVVASPTTGEPKTDASGALIHETALAVGSEWLLQAGAGRRWLGDRLGTRLELQVKGALASEATAGHTLVDGLVEADWRLARGAWRLFGAVGGAMTTGYGAAQLRVMAGFRFDPGLLANDADGDGLDDRDDRCPTQAEDRDGFQDADGCPDPDNDGDGVLDAVDRCPLVPEDRDGRDDADGCPDLDDDGDGIPDAQDRCPTVPEDRDGFDDADGCPDVDNDGDGILDIDDLCPDAPEDKKGAEPYDGCPDAPRWPLVIDEGKRLRIGQPIGFVFGAAGLSVAGRKVVDGVARYLIAHKELIALEIAVFTDDNGDRRLLKKLSQARAERVKTYLVRRAKLAPQQVRAVGRGAAQPIADNATLTGRSRNRRVEIGVLKRTAPPPQARTTHGVSATAQPRGRTAAGGSTARPAATAERRTRKPMVTKVAPSGPPAARPMRPAPEDGPPPARPTP